MALSESKRSDRERRRVKNIKKHTYFIVYFFKNIVSQCAFKVSMNHVVRWECYGGYWKRTD